MAFENKTKHDFLNALQKSQLDGFELLMQEMRHHALCYRSISVIPHYTELLVAALAPISGVMVDNDKQRAANYLEGMQFHLESASSEMTAEYMSVSQRTVIVLADLLENLVEATLGLCLLNLDAIDSSVREITKFKQEITNERRLKRAVKSWESSLSSNLVKRTDRLEYMIKSFFPNFYRPANFEILDMIFEDRNTFTHEKIRLAESDIEQPIRRWTLQMIDDAFEVAGDFLMALMKAIPGSLQAPIAFVPH